MCTPLRWLEQQRIRKRHCGFNVHHRPERAGADALAKLCHFRMEATVITQAKGDSGFASRVDGSFRFVLRERKRFFTKDVFSGLRCSNHLLGMH